MMSPKSLREMQDELLSYVLTTIDMNKIHDECKENTNDCPNNIKRLVGIIACTVRLNEKIKKYLNDNISSLTSIKEICHNRKIFYNHNIFNSDAVPAVFEKFLNEMVVLLHEKDDKVTLNKIDISNIYKKHFEIFFNDESSKLIDHLLELNKNQNLLSTNQTPPWNLEENKSHPINTSKQNKRSHEDARPIVFIYYLSKKISNHNPHLNFEPSVRMMWNYISNGINGKIDEINAYDLYEHADNLIKVLYLELNNISDIFHDFIEDITIDENGNIRTDKMTLLEAFNKFQYNKYIKHFGNFNC